MCESLRVFKGESWIVRHEGETYIQSECTKGSDHKLLQLATEWTCWPRYRVGMSGTSAHQVVVFSRGVWYCLQGPLVQGIQPVVQSSCGSEDAERLINGGGDRSMLIKEHVDQWGDRSMLIYQRVNISIWLANWTYSMEYWFPKIALRLVPMMGAKF